MRRIRQQVGHGRLVRDEDVHPSGWRAARASPRRATTPPNTSPRAAERVDDKQIVCIRA
jgi:hypothetical protein